MILAALDLAGYGAFLGGAALFVGACAAAYSTVVAANRIKMMAPIVVSTQEVTADTNRMASQIDSAVNGQPPGAKKLVHQVQELHAETFPVVTDDEINGAALLPLVKLLVEDMNRRNAAINAEGV